MKGSHGYRRKTRNLKVGPREKGKISIRKVLADFQEGEIVSISIDSRIQAIPHPMFRGRTGKVVGKQGKCYLIQISDGGKQKKLLVSPVHLIKSGVGE
ncbi:MAG: 50S ribosomal protein L21e [Candidatus Altiarchaeota archaeon]